MLATRSPSFLHLVHDQRCYLSEHRSWAPRRQQFLSAPSISPYPPSPAFSKVNHLLRTCCSSPTAALSPGVTVLPFSSCLLNNTPGSWEHLKCGTPHEHDWACLWSRICPNCTHTELFSVLCNFSVFCISRRGVSRCKLCCTVAQSARSQTHKGQCEIIRDTVPETLLF